jgi:transposase
MKETMMIREIAELTGKSNSAVKLWLSKMTESNQISGQILSGIKGKTVQAQKTSKPAEFTPDETIAIIRAGE